MKSVEEYLEPASFGFSENKRGSIYTLRKSTINPFSRLLFEFCERTINDRYSLLRKALMSVVNLTHEIQSGRITRLNPDLLYITTQTKKSGSPFQAKPEDLGTYTNNISNIGFTTVINPQNGKSFLMHYQELQEILDKNEQGRLEALDENYKQDLINSGFIIPKHKYLKISQTPENSLNIWLNIGYECPNGCGFCWAGQGSKEKTHRYDHVKEFEEGEIEQFTIGITKSLENLGSNKVTIKLAGGGEPLVYFRNITNLLPQIIQSLKEKSPQIEINFVIITSGIGLTEEMCKFFKENNVYISLAIGGDEFGHWQSRPFINLTSSWPHVINAINLLIKTENDYNLSMVLCDKNIHSLVNHEMMNFRNFFMMLDRTFGKYIPIDFSIARPSSGEPMPITDMDDFAASLREVTMEYLKYQKYWTGRIDYQKIDYTAITGNAGKKYTCFAGHSYIGVTSFKEPKRIATLFGKWIAKIIQVKEENLLSFVERSLPSPLSKLFLKNVLSKLSIGACHELSDNGAIFDPNSQASMLEQANIAFYKKEGKRKKRPYLTPNEARKTCMGCALRYYCSGINEIGGCAIQRSKQENKNEVAYCQAYSTSIETMLIRGIIHTDFTRYFLPIPKKSNLKYIVNVSDLLIEKRFKALMNNLIVLFMRLEESQKHSTEVFQFTDNIDFNRRLKERDTEINQILSIIEMQLLNDISKNLTTIFQITQKLPNGFELLETALRQSYHPQIGSVEDPTEIENTLDKILLELVGGKLYNEWLHYFTNHVSRYE